MMPWVQDVLKTQSISLWGDGMGAIKSGDNKIKLMSGDLKVKRVYAGDVKIYSSGNTVTYHVDSGVVYQEEVDEGASCLSPKTFTPSKSGWTFTGWRQDKAANGSVLSSFVMGDEPVTLYAVFEQTVTLSYNGNGSTGGSTAAQTGKRYYNNDNVANPSFTLRSNGFSRTDYTFKAWALGSAGGIQYAAGASVTLSASTTMYAVWKAAEFTMILNSSGWSGPTVTQGGFSELQIVQDNPYGGVWLRGQGTTELPFAIGTITRTINTRGLPKATIAVGIADMNYGSVDIGGNSYNFFSNKTTKCTIPLDTSKTSQTLKISVSNYGDTWNTHSIQIYSIRFHE